MATTGTRLLAGTATLVTAASTIVGQGERPDAWVLYSLSDATSSFPTWTDATAVTRWFSTSRGRDSELAQVDAGTATITVDAKDRVIDPFANPLIRPMNRWWIRSQFSGVTEDVFNGYAEAYDSVFPAGGWSQALTVVQCTDEFKPLALDALPTTDPPRDTYQDLVMYDNPAGFWPLDYRRNPVPAVVGEEMTWASPTSGSSPDSAESGIVGQEEISYGSGSIMLVALDTYLTTAPLSAGQSGDAGGLSEFGVELWFNQGNFTAVSDELLVYGPESSATYTWKMVYKATTGLIAVSVKNAAGTAYTVTSTTSMAALTWYHLVATITGGSLRLYVNGTQEASTAFTGPFGVIDASGNISMTVGNKGGGLGAVQRKYDSLAFYRVGLTSARVSAHFTAGRLRGFAGSQLPGNRINAVLDYVSSTAPRSIQAGSRSMNGSYMRGQSPLEELRKAEMADAVDAVLFVSGNGTLTFLADGHRSSSPWNTVQATFDDDGTDIPYVDLGFDYSDAFLANTWNVTRVGGLVSTATDAASVTAHRPRPQVPALPDRTRLVNPGGLPPRPELPIMSDADAAAIAASMLAKYKNPFTRITSLSLDTTVAAVTEAVMALDIGDRIRVFKTHPGGGARIDQTLFVQKVEVSGQNDQQPWQIRLGVSPV